VARWVIRRHKDERQLGEVEAPNHTMALRKAYGRFPADGKLLIQSAISEQIAEEETFARDRDDYGADYADLLRKLRRR
jgi:hypothetical protein